jgi:hypothetical protein
MKRIVCKQRKILIPFWPNQLPASVGLWGESKKME